MLPKLLAIALLGALGSVARYLVADAVQQGTGGGFPWGTLAVNAIGCLLFGIVWSLANERMIITGALATILLVGFLGAFTTFSTFAFETGQLLRDSGWLSAAGNVILHNTIGLAAVFTGIAIGRSI